MNSPDWLRRLPSVNEILDKAPMRAVVEKWNRSAVTARVRSFLEEIRDEVQARTGDITLSELAERAARYVLGPSPRGAGAAINATGRLWGEPWLELPLADAALERVLLTARDYQADLAPADGVASSTEAENLARNLAGAEAAAYWHSRLGALELTLRTLATGRSAIVARGEVGRLTADCRLTDLVAIAGAKLIEVGAIDATSEDDFARACRGSTAVILRIEPEDYVVLGQSRRPEIAELAPLAREANVPLIVDLGRNPLLDGLPTDGRDVVTAQRALADGANMVILRTDGFIGGPPGALLLGAATLVEQVRRQPLAAAHRPLEMATAALAATLELFRDADHARFQVPLLSLLDTPLENLRSRAERLAPQITTTNRVAAEPLFLPEAMQAHPRASRLPSWGIALQPQDGDVTGLVEKLAQAVFPAVGRPAEQQLVLDLRTVFPRQDLDLVNAVVSS